MHKFDYSFLKTGISSKLVGACNLIVDLNSKENIRKLQYKDSFNVLQKKAIIDSVKASNAIEGIITTDERIKDIVNGSIPTTHDEKEISERYAFFDKAVCEFIRIKNDNLLEFRVLSILSVSCSFVFVSY